MSRPSLGVAVEGYGGFMQLAERIEQLFRPSVSGFKPHAFQVEVAQHLLKGKNVILQAPTGAGKTEAALAPFLLARSLKLADFPRKMFLATPLRTLAKDLHRRADTIARSLGEIRLDVRLHTGEDKGDDFFEGDLTITTIDQLMSSYVHIPLSLTSRLANLNAGAVISSYIVFDEFHLHDPQRAFRTALVMAKELAGITPFLFMTATLSDEMVHELAGYLGAEVVTVPAEALQTIPSQRKTRFFMRHSKRMSAAQVADRHEQRSLVVCNTVGRAQAIYDELVQLKAGHGESGGRLANTRFALIHARFFPSHRNAKEEALQRWMGRGSSENIILVATQVIEVGIDISCEHMHTELCPANSLLQRAGRCARYGGETGTIHVYDALDDQGMRTYRPYIMSETPEPEVQAWFDRTWDALPALVGQHVDFEAEKGLVNAVHQESDLRNLEAHTTDPKRHTKHLKEARTDASRLNARAKARDLIRNVNAVGVLIHPEPERLNTWSRVRRLEQLSLYPYQLRQLFVSGQEHSTWAVKVAYYPEGWDDESEGKPPLLWREATKLEEALSGLTICLNPLLLSYDEAQGLQFEAGKDSFESPTKEGVVESWEPHWYTFEPYELHIERVMKAAKTYAAEIFHTAPKVDAALGYPVGTTEGLVQAAIAAHDFGKLSRGWQTWTRGWQDEQLQRYPDGLWEDEFQTIRPQPQPASVYCAHTDYHPEFDGAFAREFDKARGKRPPHALESAMLLEGIALEAFYDHYEALGIDPLPAFTAVTKAINKHHGADAKPSSERGRWHLDKGAEGELLRVFRRFSDWSCDEIQLRSFVQAGVCFPDGKSQLDEVWAPEHDHPYWLLYSLVVRALRLGDQKSFPRDVKEIINA